MSQDGSDQKYGHTNSTHHSISGIRSIRSCHNCGPQPQYTTYLTIGQDYDSIQEYLENVVGIVQYHNTTAITFNDDDNDDDRPLVTETTTPTIPNSFPVPSIFMFYTDLQELRGLYEPINYGGGIQYANGLLHFLQRTPPAQQQQQQQHETAAAAAVPQSHTNAVPITPVKTGLQIGLWLNGTIGCQNILNGQLQEQIHRLFHYCMASDTTISKIYLRIGYEFDNPQFGYSDAPDLYRTAYRYIVQECYTLYSDTACRNRIDFVWHSWAASLIVVPLLSDDTESSADHNNNNNNNSTQTLDDYYPGDDYVDWVGISIFSQLYTDVTIPPHITQLGNMETIQYVCTFAQAHQKPIMIAESTPFGGMDQLHDPWQDWFVPILHLIETYHIRMWSYIYCNWDSIPMWNQTGFGDSRLEQNRTVLKLWYQHVLNNPQFRNVDDDSNDMDCDCADLDRSYTIATTKQKPPGVEVGSSQWKNIGAVQGIISGSFEYSSSTDINSKSIVSLYCSWILLANVLLWMVVATLVRRKNAKRREYEALE